MLEGLVDDYLYRFDRRILFTRKCRCDPLFRNPGCATGLHWGLRFPKARMSTTRQFPGMEMARQPADCSGKRTCVEYYISNHLGTHSPTVSSKFLTKILLSGSWLSRSDFPSFYPVLRDPGPGVNPMTPYICDNISYTVYRSQLWNYNHVRK